MAPVWNPNLAQTLHLEEEIESLRKAAELTLVGRVTRRREATLSYKYTNATPADRNTNGTVSKLKSLSLVTFPPPEGFFQPTSYSVLKTTHLDEQGNIIPILKVRNWLENMKDLEAAGWLIFNNL